MKISYKKASQISALIFSILILSIISYYGPKTVLEYLNIAWADAKYNIDSRLGNNATLPIHRMDILTLYAALEMYMYDSEPPKPLIYNLKKVKTNIRPRLYYNG